VIDRKTADAALNRMEVDALGLDLVDRRILEAMIRHYNGGPVGLDTLAAVTGEEAITIEDVYEPYLMQLGFINRTPRGRVVLPAAYAHLGIKNPNEVNNYGQTSF
jgi:Holliday junction DNA helicase RuvB